MDILNIEIKARCEDPARIRNILQRHDADFKGVDHQVDTYFDVPDGRLKLRNGTIEQNLIFYRRPNTKGPKASEIHLVPVEHPEDLLSLLQSAIGVDVVVDKEREIYFIDNVKFHIDKVQRLGTFVEIEAIDRDGNRDRDQLRAQCDNYLELLDLDESKLVALSYSDLITGT